MLWRYTLLLLILLSVMFLGIKSRKLTPAAAMTGGLLGFLIYEGAGFTGIAMTGIFFLIGSAATSFKMDFKETHGLAEKNKGRRKWTQVVANAGVAGLLGILAIIAPQLKPLLQVMIAASLASATADTLSSELGMVYGRSFYNIRTLKKDHRGLDGVISLEGTLFGMAGSVVIATIYAIGFGWGIPVLLIIIAGTIGNLADSFLGATLERGHLLNNDAVNFLNTLIAALAALLFLFIFK